MNEPDEVISAAREWAKARELGLAAIREQSSVGAAMDRMSRAEGRLAALFKNETK